MCQICTDLGLKPDDVAREDARKNLTRNDDGTYTLRLTETQMTNLLIRLAASVIAERRD